MAKQKNPHAQALGRLGGFARAKALGPEGLRRANTRAIKARWKKVKAESAA
jgi:hypothetical protein